MAKSPLVYVGMKAPHNTLKYGFRTKLESDYRATLGQVAIEPTTPVAGLAIGVNAPKPKKAIKRFATGTKSSFVAGDKEDDAVKAEWDVVRARPNGRKRDTQFQVAVYVTINTLKYGWGMRKVTFERIKGSLAALGIKRVTPADNDVIFGASFPKPPKAVGGTVSGTAKNQTTNRINTFSDPDVELPAGFLSSGGRYTAGDLVDLL